MNDYLDMKINKHETVNEIIQNGLFTASYQQQIFVIQDSDWKKCSEEKY